MLRRVVRLGQLIRFSHSVFALPFAILVFAVLVRDHAVSAKQAGLLLMCIIGARSAAMAFNRIADLQFDAANPRTQGRELPSGAVVALEAWGLFIASSALFFLAAYLLGPHCLVMAGPVMVLLLGYSYLKRFTAWCHFALGAALACAPGGVWYAVTGRFAWEPVPLMIGVLFWVSGFDILYALQDRDFDSEHRLHSVPVALGERGSRVIAAACHMISVLFLTVAAWPFALHTAYYVGVVLFGVNVALQHRDLSRGGIGVIDQAFFLRNGVASILLCLCGLIDLWRL